MDYSSETERKIVQAATEVFIQKGKDGARMQEIAHRAGINQALLHYYFRSKDRLYREVFKNEVSRQFRDFFNSVPVTEEMQEFLHSFIHHYIDKLHENPQLIRFILWEIGSGGENFPELFREIFDSTSKISPQSAIEKIKQAVQRNEIRPVDPHNLLFSIIGLCIYTFLAQPLLKKLFPEVDFTANEFIEKRKEEVFNLIWHGIKP